MDDLPLLLRPMSRILGFTSVLKGSLKSRTGETTKQEWGWDAVTAVNEMSFTSASDVIYDPQTMLRFQIQRALTPSPCSWRGQLLQSAKPWKMLHHHLSHNFRGPENLGYSPSRAGTLEHEAQRFPGADYGGRESSLSIAEQGPSLPRSSVSALKRCLFIWVMPQRNNFGLHQNLKLLCFKGHLSKKWRQPKEWEKTFANNICDKDLVSRIYKEVLQFNSKKIGQ